MGENFLEIPTKYTLFGITSHPSKLFFPLTALGEEVERIVAGSAIFCYFAVEYKNKKKNNRQENMTKKIFNNFDALKAEKSPAYMIDWKAERAQTDRIIQFILRILKLNNICRGTITKRAGMGNGQIGRILKCDADKVLHPNMAKRLAITTITLIPDLNKHEALRHETTNNTWPYAVCRIDDTDLREKLRAEFIAAFGSFGQYLVEELKDMDEAMKACNDFYQSYTKLNNK